MSSESKDHLTRTLLLAENEDLRRQLEEAQQTLEAIRRGDVDALVVAGPRGEQVFSITGAEHIYRVIVETMNEASLTVDLNGTILFCNQRFCDLMKTPIHEVIGQKVTTFAARPQQPSLRALLADGQIGAIQRRVTLRATDGTPVPVQISASPLQMDGAISICLVASDLTELEASANSIRVLREHQQALEESEARFRAIFESSQDAVVITNDEGVYVQANPAVQAIFGLPPEQLIGRRVSEFFGQATDFPTFWQSFLATGSFRGEMLITSADGQVRYVESYAVTNILPGWHLSVIRDITERKQAQEDLLTANEQLRIQTEELRAINEELSAREEALRMSEEKFRTLHTMSPVGIVLNRLDDGQFLESNQALCDMTGYTEEEFRSLTYWDITPIEYKDMEATQLELLHTVGRYGPYEKEYIRKDGTRFPVLLTGVCIKDPSGTDLIYSVIQDITALKSKEQALRESEEKYRTLFTSIDEGFCIIEMVFDADGKPADYRFLEVNPAFEKQTGLHEAQGKRMRDLVPDHETHWFETYGKIALTGEPARFVNEAKALNRWYNVYAFCVGGRESRKVAVLFDDITERRRTEEALRESRERLERAQEIAHLGSWELDLVNNRLTWSDEVYRIFGLQPQEFGETYEAFLDCVHPEDRARVDAAYTGSLRENRDTYEIEHRVVHKATGETRIVHEKCEHFRDAAGRITRSVGMVHDITERKRAEEALRELTRTLESKVVQRTAELEYRAGQLQKLTLELSETEDRERERIAEILHDDLQQILAAAKFHLNVLRNRAKYDPSMQATAAQIDHMLKDAIDKSRSLSHELSPAVLHHADFGETLGWLAGQIQTKHGLLVHVHAFSKVELRSDALKTFLYKAAQELLFNVVKHARVNEARIRVRQCGRCVCLSVSDQGRGFDPQELRSATAGFGLFSIRERVELLGGRMKIKSAKGKGSTFHIVVPDGQLVEPGIAGGPLPADHAKEAGRAPGDQGRRLRVLLADDHEIVREGLISLLSEEHNIQVVGEAANGREVVDLADRLRPDVIIMDVAMPLIDGDEATRQIKRHLPDTRVIALSMYQEDGTRERMFKAGAEAYILKTAPSEDLLAAIRGKTPDT